MITPDSKIEFHKLHYSTQIDEHYLYSVVRWDTDDSFKIDHNIIIVLQLITQGKSVREAAHAINFSPDIIIMVLNIMEKSHFIKSIDGKTIYDTGERIKPWLTNVNRKWFRWIFNNLLDNLIIIFTITGIFVGLILYGIPSYKSFFWTSDLFTVFLSLFLIGTILAIFHESCHFIATKAAGGEAVMRVNYRYIFLVAETESYHLAIIPKKLRYRIYLAGMMFDLFSIAFIYWYLTFTKIFGIQIGILYNFLIALVVYQWIGIIWEFNVFLETDMYNFLSDYMNIPFLRNDALNYLSLHTESLQWIIFKPVKKFLGLFSEKEYSDKDDLRSFTKLEKRKLLFYIVILILGIIFVTLQFIFYSLPRDLTFLFGGIQGMIQAYNTSYAIGFGKSAGLVFLLTYDYILLLYLKIYRMRKIKIQKKRN